MKASSQVERAAEAEGREVGAAVEEVAVEGPGEAHAAVGHLNVVLGAVLEGLGGGHPSRRRPHSGSSAASGKAQAP